MALDGSSMIWVCFLFLEEFQLQDHQKIQEKGSSNWKVRKNQWQKNLSKTTSLMALLIPKEVLVSVSVKNHDQNHLTRHTISRVFLILKKALVSIKPEPLSKQKKHWAPLETPQRHRSFSRSLTPTAASQKELRNWRGRWTASPRTCIVLRCFKFFCVL